MLSHSDTGEGRGSTGEAECDNKVEEEVNRGREEKGR
jgi:hypothetical protein